MFAFLIHVHELNMNNSPLHIIPKKFYKKRFVVILLHLLSDLITFDIFSSLNRPILTLRKQNGLRMPFHAHFPLIIILSKYINLEIVMQMKQLPASTLSH